MGGYNAESYRRKSSTLRHAVGRLSPDYGLADLHLTRLVRLLLNIGMYSGARNPRPKVYRCIDGIRM